MLFDEFAMCAHSAAVVRVVRHDHVDWRRRKSTPDLANLTDRESIAELVDALSYDVPPHDDYAWMQPAEFTFGFGDDSRSELVAVSYLHGGWLRHESWGGDRRLSRPNSIAAWLESHGVR